MSRARQGEEAEWASVDEPNAAIGIETVGVGVSARVGVEGKAG
ncbi:MAG: hypothetical protein U0U69_03450 [Acidimicrobiia bacterium]